MGHLVELLFQFCVEAGGAKGAHDVDLLCPKMGGTLSEELREAPIHVDSTVGHAAPEEPVEETAGGKGRPVLLCQRENLLCVHLIEVDHPLSPPSHPVRSAGFRAGEAAG